MEPMRRDTFPAVMLSCAYLLSKKVAKPDDVVAFLPVDPYTTGEFFSLYQAAWRPDRKDRADDRAARRRADLPVHEIRLYRAGEGRGNIFRGCGIPREAG